MTPSSTTTSSTDLGLSLKLYEVKPGLHFSVATLRSLLPDAETCLFFGKVYELDAQQMGALLHTVLNTDLTAALFAGAGEHSIDLQDYVVDLTAQMPPAQRGKTTFKPDVPQGEVLPHVWEQLEVVVAKSIKEVAAKLEGVVDMLPGKQGSMVFSSMMKLNAKRPTIGDFRASVTHERNQIPNLLILDVSGSMSESTIRKIIDDVVALSYKANACMAVVSNTTTFWEAGTYSVDDVLRACEFSGTHYETLAPLFDGRDWGTVITVADYDSSYFAKPAVAAMSGRITEVIDVSLVNQPTFLAEVVGQLADSVRPILIGSSQYMLA